MITIRPKEKILLVKHRHRLVLMKNLLPELIIFCTVLIATIILSFVHFPSWPRILLKFLPSLAKYEFRYLLLFFATISLLFLWAIIFLVVANYYLDYWIVTNERTIHTELKGIFSRVSSSVNHDKIQDVTVEVKGLFPTLLNFGNLYIETAGEFQRFVFKQIPDPYRTRDIIFKAQREFLKKMKKNGLL